MQDAKEEVRARLNIEDVIGEYVQLKRAGRNFKGLSPFTSEKSPSFVVSPDKHIWHDFSSNKGGDVFSFIMEVEGVDFRQALEHLAQKAGVDLSVFESKGSQELARRKKRLFQANDLAAQYYQHSLLKNPHAIEYVFKQRALTRQIVQDFRIGYAPTGGRALVDFLTKKGFSQQELNDCGLTNRFGGDLFRGRMMVPLMDSTGQVIGFTARILSGDDPNAPKYLNTPQTVLYDKSRHVFGLSQAKDAIRTNDYAVIVEGNLDVVSSHQVGIHQVVATAGTAMTEQHLLALRRFSGTVKLAFDGDRAGLQATERAIPIAEKAGIALTIISLPDGFKDPDELIQKDIALWQSAIDQSEPVIDWILKQYAGREDMTTAAGKRSFTTAALSVIRMLHSVVEQEHYLQLAAEWTNGLKSNLRTLLADISTSPETTAVKRPITYTIKPAKPDAYLYQDNLLAAALIDPATHDLFTSVEPTTFAGEDRQALASYIKNHGGEAIKDTPQELQKYDTYVKIVLLKAETRYADWNDQDRYFETARLLRQVTNEHKKKTQELLTNQLRDAETTGDDARAEELRAQLNTLIKEITRGQR